MVQSSTTVTLPQMVDLALNCPEMGTLNFTVLHTLMHVLIKLLNHTTVAVEFQGTDSERINTLVTATKPAVAFNLTEYKVVGDQLKPKKSKQSLTDVKTKSKTKDIADKEKGGKEESAEGNYSMYSAVVVVDRGESGLPRLNVAATLEQLNEVRKELSALKMKYQELADLPGNMDLIEASKEGSSPILDMFQLLKLSKRVDANEQGLDKLASILEDIAKTSVDIAIEDRDSRESLAAQASEVRSAIDNKLLRSTSHISKALEQRISRLEKVVTNLEQDLSGGKTRKCKRKHREKSSTLNAQDTEETGSVTEDKDQGGEKLDGTDVEEVPPNQAVLELKQGLEAITNLMDNYDMEQLWKDVNELKDLLKSDSAELPPDIKMKDFEMKLGEAIDQLANIDTTYGSQLSSLQKDLLNAQGEIERLSEMPGIDNQVIGDLQNGISRLTEDFNALADTTAKLLDEKVERDRHTQVILEQIDLLTIAKANREDLEEALGDKADACAINRKVSHDQFDAACDDLAKGIDEALTKLTQQESMWYQAMDDIQKEIGNKIDRIEVDPLKDFVNSKLKSLHEKFKTLTALKKEQEAAGTKSKLLRDVNCISCDKDVVMKKEMDSSLKPQARALPPARNIAPYLAYELDQLRKQQRCFPNSKNLNYFENALKTSKDKGSDHICNRYCGGSHTTTTPQQRVTRLGHFLEQWGPEISPVNDEYIRGNDNHMYKARDDEALKQAVSADSARGKGGSKAGQGARGGSKTILSDIAENKVDNTIILDEEAKELLSDHAKEKFAGVKDSKNLLTFSGHHITHVHTQQKGSHTGHTTKVSIQDIQVEVTKDGSQTKNVGDQGGEHKKPAKQGSSLIKTSSQTEADAEKREKHKAHIAFREESGKNGAAEE